MTPILYKENETSYRTNGIGRLTDALSCTVKQERNGIYELYMRYPKDGIHVQDISVNRIIYAVPESGKKPQPFVIREINKSLRNQIQITARQRGYELSYYACAEFGRTDAVPYQFTPILYDSNQAPIGELDDYIDYDVEVNFSKWILTMKYPTSGNYASSITTSCYIYAQPDIGRDLRLFDITTVSTSGSVKTITAECHIENDPAHEVNQMTVFQALGYVQQYTNVIQPCPFTFTAQPKTPGSAWATSFHEFWNETPISTRELLMEKSGQLQATFGGEWEFDDYSCILHEARGVDNGVTYRYGKNISDITERINIDALYTHAFSFWKGTASSSTNTQEGEYFVKKGTIIKALDDQYAALFPTTRVMVIDASSDFEQEPTVEELDDYTAQYIELNSVGVPAVTINVSVIDLSGSDDYADIAALETINLCDTVSVFFPDFDISIKAKITALEYNVLLDRNNTITIGETEVNLSDIIAENRANIVRTKRDLQKWADHMAERATEATSGWYGGNVRKNYDANDHKQQSMYIMDTDDVNTATASVRVDGHGVGVSINGAKGGYKPIVDFREKKVYFGETYWDLENDTIGGYIKNYLENLDQRVTALENE